MPRQYARTVCEEFIRIELYILIWDDKRFDVLAENFIGDANDRRLAELAAFTQALLHFGRTNAKTGRLDQVVATTNKIEETVFVHSDQVS